MFKYALAAAVILVFAACDPSVFLRSEHIVCIVDGDTINVPRDTTGIKCEDPSSLNPWAEDTTATPDDSVVSDQPAPGGGGLTGGSR